MTDGYRAVVKDITISAQKVRLVVDMVRGKDVQEALALLQFVPNRAAKPIYKVLRSAMINAEENHGIDRSGLYIESIFADEARTRKWRRFGARGRFKPWLRRSSHVTVVLKERN
jgi:large subunit ribosomal protein L22